MGRTVSPKTLAAKRRQLAKALDIAKKLRDQAKLDAETDPKAFLEYLALDIYLERLLSNDNDQYRTAKEMLAYTLSKKRQIPVDPAKDKGNKPFEPKLPETKPVNVPDHIKAKVHSITGTAMK